MWPDSGHQSVLLNEVVDLLKEKPDGIFLDCTLGRAGHSSALLKATQGKCRIIGLDQDQEALKKCEEILAPYKDSVILKHANFAVFDKVLNELNIDMVDGVLFDLGVSSNQLDEAERGFSFRFDSDLDMRMDRTQELTAADVVNLWDEKKLADLIYNYGEERYSRRIARIIVEARGRKPISTTLELAGLIERAYPRRGYHRIHPATRTFQALRIAVNRELEVLETALSKVLNYVCPGGLICIIAFHSLEDRIVKHTFREWKKEGLVTLLTKKPLCAGENELKGNKRSRSAKMRVAKRSLQL